MRAPERERLEVGVVGVELSVAPHEAVAHERRVGVRIRATLLVLVHHPRDELAVADEARRSVRQRRVRVVAQVAVRLARLRQKEHDAVRQVGHAQQPLRDGRIDARRVLEHVRLLRVLDLAQVVHRDVKVRYGRAVPAAGALVGHRVHHGRAERVACEHEDARAVARARARNAPQRRRTGPGRVRSRLVERLSETDARAQRPYEPRVKGGARLPRARPAHEVGGLVAPVHALLRGVGRAAVLRTEEADEAVGTVEAGRPLGLVAVALVAVERRTHLQLAVEALARNGLAQLQHRRVPRARIGHNLGRPRAVHAHGRGARAPLGREDLDGHVLFARVQSKRHVLVRARRFAPLGARQEHRLVQRAQRPEQVRLEACGALVQREDARHRHHRHYRVRQGFVAPFPFAASAENIATPGRYRLGRSCHDHSPTAHQPAPPHRAHRVRHENPGEALLPHARRDAHAVQGGLQ